MLEWNVIYGNFNSHEIETFNIFDHVSFRECCAEAAKKYRNDRDAFIEAVRKELMYYYWSKCEWEVIIQHWPPSERLHDKKIDVYDQVRMNWPIFADYVWNHKDEL